MSHMKGTYNGKPCVHGHGVLRYKAGGACTSCCKEKSKARWANGTKKKGKYDPADRRERNLKAKYGITQVEYEKRLANQGYACALCGAAAGDKRFHVDHDHETTVVRDLLCNKCNVGLGSFDDSPDKLRLAIAYLRKHYRI